MYLNKNVNQEKTAASFQPKVFLCQRHNEGITNYSIQELKPLCPECVQEISLNQIDDRTVNSIKNVKTSCSQKLKTCINELNKQMESSEIKYLWNPQSIIEDGAIEINKCKSQLMKIIDFHFEQLQINFRQQVNENILKASDLAYIFENIKQSIFELEQLSNSLETGQTIQAITKICQLDLLTLVNKFKTDIHKIVDSRDLDPIKIQVSPNAFNTFKELLPSLAVISKQNSHFHQHLPASPQSISGGTLMNSQKKFHQNNLNYFPKYDLNDQFDPLVPKQELQLRQQLLQENQLQMLQEQARQSLYNNMQYPPFDTFQQAPYSSNQQKRAQDYSPYQDNFAQPPQNQQNRRNQNNRGIKAQEHFRQDAKTRLLVDIQDNYLQAIDLDLYYSGNPSAAFQIEIKEQLPSEFALIVASNGEIFIFGGILNGKATSEISRLVISSNRSSCKLQSISNMSAPRYAPSLIELDKTIMIIGGFSSEGQCKTEIEAYHYENNRLDVLIHHDCKIPSARSSLAILANRYIVKIGGVNDKGLVVQKFEYCDSQTGEWEEFEPFYTKSSQQFFLNYAAGSIAISDVEVIVFGGRNDTSDSNMCFSILFLENEIDVSNVMKYPLPFQVSFISSQPLVYQDRIVFLEQYKKKAVVSFSGDGWVVGKGVDE